MVWHSVKRIIWVQRRLIRRPLVEEMQMFWHFFLPETRWSKRSNLHSARVTAYLELKKKKEGKKVNFIPQLCLCIGTFIDCLPSSRSVINGVNTLVSAECKVLVIADIKTGELVWNSLNSGLTRDCRRSYFTAVHLIIYCRRRERRRSSITFILIDRNCSFVKMAHILQRVIQLSQSHHSFVWRVNGKKMNSSFHAARVVMGWV